MKERISRDFVKALGPGLLMAGAAVGVSHLVQATRAGAEYGFVLVWLVVLACLFKYPFLEYGPRYAAATGESLLQGYRRMGRWALAVFTAVTLLTMFAIQAAVTVVTAGLAAHLFGVELTPLAWSAMVLGACVFILLVGRFHGLDLSMKIIMSVLAVSTVSAVVIALLGAPPDTGVTVAAPALWTAAGVTFLLALMGWMPIPIDVAAWHSLWTLERGRQTRHHPSVWHAVLDFAIGYVGAALLAVMFLCLGALVMFGSGERFSAASVVFSTQLVNMYGVTLGTWSLPVISLAVFTVMFSTTLAVTDAYPRVLTGLLGVWGAPRFAAQYATRLYAAFLLLVLGGALVVLAFFAHRFTLLIDIAAIASFLSAPVLGWINLRLLTGEHTPAGARPGPGLRALSWAGLVFLSSFCLLFIYWRFFTSA